MCDSEFIKALLMKCEEDKEIHLKTGLSLIFGELEKLEIEYRKGNRSINEMQGYNFAMNQVKTILNEFKITTHYFGVL